MSQWQGSWQGWSWGDDTDWWQQGSWAACPPSGGQVSSASSSAAPKAVAASDAGDRDHVLSVPFPYRVKGFPENFLSKWKATAEAQGLSISIRAMRNQAWRDQIAGPAAKNVINVKSRAGDSMDIPAARRLYAEFCQELLTIGMPVRSLRESDVQEPVDGVQDSASFEVTLHGATAWVSAGGQLQASVFAAVDAATSTWTVYRIRHPPSSSGDVRREETRRPRWPERNRSRSSTRSVPRAACPPPQSAPAAPPLDVAPVAPPPHAKGATLPSSIGFAASPPAQQHEARAPDAGPPAKRSKPPPPPSTPRPANAQLPPPPPPPPPAGPPPVSSAKAQLTAKPQAGSSELLPTRSKATSSIAPAGGSRLLPEWLFEPPPPGQEREAACPFHDTAQFRLALSLAREAKDWLQHRDPNFVSRRRRLCRRRAIVLEDVGWRRPDGQALQLWAACPPQSGLRQHKSSSTSLRRH